MFNFSNHIDPILNVPILNEEQWKEMLHVLPEKEERTSLLIDAILAAKPTGLPERLQTAEECEAKFRKLLNRDHTDFMIPVRPDELFVQKFMDYDFEVGPLLGLIQLGHQSNPISDYFQRQNRMRCGGYDLLSPWDIWNGTDMDSDEHRKKLRRLLMVLWRMKNKKRLGVSEYQECFRLAGGVYTAAQFKVHTAKTVYDFFNANDVIDFSMGWGDRLAGWYARKAPGVFIGCDPNADVFEKYVDQAVNYSTWRDEGCDGDSNDDYFTIHNQNKKLVAYRSPAEDIDWTLVPKVDLVFTSPPYFGTELYAEGTEHEEDQSWKRYGEYEAWFSGFMEPIIRSTTFCLKDGGHLALNIIDIDYKKGHRHRVCDQIHTLCSSLGLEYQGVLGMRMKQRPKKFKNDEHKEEFMSAYFIEPIWVWRKAG